MSMARARARLCVLIVECVRCAACSMPPHPVSRQSSAIVCAYWKISKRYRKIVFIFFFFLILFILFPLYFVCIVCYLIFNIAAGQPTNVLKSSNRSIFIRFVFEFLTAHFSYASNVLIPPFIRPRRWWCELRTVSATISFSVETGKIAEVVFCFFLYLF